MTSIRNDHMLGRAQKGRLGRRIYRVGAIMFLALLSSVLLETWFVLFSFPGYKTAAIKLQRLQAEAVADKIGAYITATTSQLGWTTQLPWSNATTDQRRFDALRLLRQVPAITEIVQFDLTGYEKFRLERNGLILGYGHPYQKEFAEAVAKKVYYGPVYGSDPHMTLALAGDAGVSVADISLKLIWDEASRIKLGDKGDAYLVDAQGRLIAHPDISLVLRNTDMTRLSQVAAARAAVNTGAGAGPDSELEQVEAANDIVGREVFTAYAPVAPLGWLVFVELPVEEAYEPLYFAMERSFGPLLVGLTLAFFGIAWLSSRSRRRASPE